MIKFKRYVIFLLLPVIAGCAAAAVSGAGMGIEYTITNVAYRTLNYPLDQVNQATLQALKKMDIKIQCNWRTEEGREIEAYTKDLTIVIDLEYITSKATRIKVDAREAVILKDKATAAEIINQVDKILEERK